jgi:hypothetical protein
MIVRDNNDACLGARSKTKELVADPTTAEAMVALSAMYFCREAGFFDVVRRCPSSEGYQFGPSFPI